MPNRMSPDSRRANFIVDKEFYESLEAKAAHDRVSVGELIRRALESQYPDIPVKNPVVSIRVQSNPTKFTQTQADKSGNQRRRRDQVLIQ